MTIDSITIELCYEDGYNMQAKLRPFSAITDDEAAHITALAGYFTLNNISEGRRILTELFINDVHCGLQMSTNFQIFQYLISIGVDLPHYLLDGKTLQEAGLAIYEWKQLRLS